MRALGTHLLVEFYDCDLAILDNFSVIQSCMLEAARLSNATVVGDKFHKFSPYGVSGVVVIAESHLSIHTWYEHAYAAVDLFTCSDKMNPDICFHYLKEKLGAKSYSVVEIKRGILANIQN